MTLIIDQRVRHHTTEQVEEAVRETLEIASRLELEGDDKQLLLPGILNLVAAVHLQLADNSLLTAGRLHG